MKVFLRSVFDCAPEMVWREVKKSSLLLEITKPLVKITDAREKPLPRIRKVGETEFCRSYLFGFILLGTRKLFFEAVDEVQKRIQTRESDALIRQWDHGILISITDDEKTLYSDEIKIDAGILTFPVWFFANIFYRHRQRRWKKVVERLKER